MFGKDMLNKRLLWKIKIRWGVTGEVEENIDGINGDGKNKNF